MFKTNERLLGRKIEYDGNPHKFGAHNYGENPHRFHIVGGTFMNSSKEVTDGEEDSTWSIISPPTEDRLQPLICSGSQGDDHTKEFEPFFKDGGKTPWGDAVSELQQDQASPRRKEYSAAVIGSNEPGRALLNYIQKSAFKLQQDTKPANHSVQQEATSRNSSSFIPTDSQITRLSNATKQASSASTRQITTYASTRQTAMAASTTTKTPSSKSRKTTTATKPKSTSNKPSPTTKTSSQKKTKNKSKSTKSTMARESSKARRHKPSTPKKSKRSPHEKLLSEWVKKLERPPATPLFGPFRFDVGAIMTAVGEVATAS